MAASFTLNSGSYQGRYMYVTCTQTKDIASNRNRIDWTLTVTGGSSNYYTTGPTTLTIAGQQAYYKAQTYYTSKAFPAAKGSVSGTVWVDAAADGSCSVWVGLSTAIYVSAVSDYGGTWYLDNIPRAASLLSAPNFNVWENPTVTYSNPAGNAADVQISIHNPEGNHAYAGYRSMSRTGSSYTFSLSDAERNAITNAVPNGTNTMYVTFYIRTLINGSIVDGSIRGLTRIVTVKRGANITGAPNFTDEDNPTITYNNPGGNTVGDLQAGIYDTNGATTYAGYRSISKTAGSHTFNLTADERQRLINAIPNGKNSTTVRFYLATTIDGSVYHRSYVNKTLTITNAAPNISCEVKDTGSASTQLTNDPNVLIRGFNNVSATMTPSLKKGASVNSKSIVNGGQTVSELSTVFNNTENGVFTFNLVDSFGQPISKQVTLDVVPYIKLTCDIDTNKPSSDGNTSFVISGNYFNDKFGKNGDNNTLTVKWRIKENSGEYGEWITANPTLKDSSYEATVNLTGLDYRSSYTVQAIASDLINTSGITSAEKVIKSFPVFNWGEDNFDVNVPLRVDDIVCKTNICDGQLELGTYENVNGEKSDNIEGWINYRCVNPVEVEPSTSYVFHVNGVPQKQVVLFYDENHGYIAEDRGVIGDGIFTTLPGTKYITFRCFAADYVEDFVNLKVEIFKLSPIKTKTINGSGIYGSGDLLVSNPGITLYENSSGNSGTVTLSDSITNYEYIEIFFLSSSDPAPGYDHNSAKVPAINGRSAFLITGVVSSGPNANLKLKVAKMNDNTITNYATCEAALNGNFYNYNYIAITKVVGIPPRPITYIDGNGVKY